MKTAVMIGGTRGIDAALASAFLKSGRNVAYSGTAEDTVEKLLKSLAGQFAEGNFAAFKCNFNGEIDICVPWKGAIVTA